MPTNPQPTPLASLPFPVCLPDEPGAWGEMTLEFQPRSLAPNSLLNLRGSRSAAAVGQPQGLCPAGADWAVVALVAQQFPARVSHSRREVLSWH